MKRSSGILLHISSLPSSHGIGDLGQESYAFADQLFNSNQKYWQILPTSPTDPICDNSPYSSASAFAGNILFISLDLLIKKGLLKVNDFSKINVSDNQIDFKSVIDFKLPVLFKAYKNFKSKGGKLRFQFEEFIKNNNHWLVDYALFVVLKDVNQGQPWWDWEHGFKNRDNKELVKFTDKYKEQIEEVYFYQFIFHKQFDNLRKYCNKKNIKIIGDIPIYVNLDSSDVWSNQNLFKLDDSGRPKVVSGVPPDYFSAIGQRWGNPVYDWGALKRDEFSWWIKRLTHCSNLFDIVRVDHFRAFVNYWEIPEKEETAINGKWVNVPTDDFFNQVKKDVKGLSIIAEDLGLLDEKTRDKIDSLKFPCMNILMFAFSDNITTHQYLPHNVKRNSVYYTGTHDNNTLLGWYNNEASEKELKNLSMYLKKSFNKKEFHWDMIKLVSKSKANLVLFPMQDVLGLNEKARMNKPASPHGNWSWRLLKQQFNKLAQNRLAKLTKECNR